MAYRVELAESAAREIEKLDAPQRKRILKFLQERVAKLENPRSIGQALRGSELGEFWKYRVGDFRVIARIQDEKLVVLVVRIGHRREVYRSVWQQDSGTKSVLKLRKHQRRIKLHGKGG